MVEEKGQSREKEKWSYSLPVTYNPEEVFISGELMPDCLFELDDASTQALLAYFT